MPPAPPPRPPRGPSRRRQGAAGATVVIIETSAVVAVLGAIRAGRRPPRWFEESRGGGRLAVPRTVEVELKRLRKSNRRGAGSRADLSWLARLRGRDLQWVYDLYREAPIDARVLSEVERMHGEAARDRDGAAARAWLRSKRSFVRERCGRGGGPGGPGGPEGVAAGRALAALNRAAANDRAIMAQAVAIAAAAARSGGGGGGGGGASPPAAVLVSRDGDFTAFAGGLEEIAGGSMSVVHYARM